MLSNVNALMAAWAVSLIIVVGGVLMLEAAYTPTEPTAVEGTAEKQQASMDTTPRGEPSYADTRSSHESPDTSYEPTETDSPYTDDELTGLPLPGEQKAAPQIAITNPTYVIPAVALPELLEKTEQGFLPKISDDGRRSFDVYAAANPQTKTTARIALMVTDLGKRSRNTQRALAELPKDVALAFSPYSRDLNSWGERARRAGHEVFISIPMEPVNYPQNDPGPFTLLTTHSKRESISILRTSLSQMSGYVGVVNSMGSRFTAASESMRPVLDEIHRRGLMFVDSRSTPYSRAATMAKAIGLPVAINNGYIDEDLARVEIAAELTKLEQRAKTQGAAMGMARAYPVTIDAIKVWVATLEERGLALVPVSSIANLQAIPR